jgi:hypothetical protein
MIQHAHNPNIWEAGKEDQEFEANLNYIVRPYQRERERKRGEGGREGRRKGKGEEREGGREEGREIRIQEE